MMRLHNPSYCVNSSARVPNGIIKAEMIQCSSEKKNNIDNYFQEERDVFQNIFNGLKLYLQRTNTVSYTHLRAH